MGFILVMKIVLLSILALTEGYSDRRKRSFKSNFMFGVGSSAYQVEGAWNIDGKGESIWDNYLHNNPDIIADGRNGDVASDSYHLYKRDVEMLRELGVDHYRFSIAWSRILPTGFPNKINEKGLQYYDNLIDELLKYNIEPMVTMYHMDLPQPLQDLGGWANPLSRTWFQDYAKVIFDRYANRVKYWVTINQPNNICIDGYGKKHMAPALGIAGIADYMCIKNVLLAHAKAYRLYETEYKNKNKGLVGIALSLNWADQYNNETENTQARDEFRLFTLDLYIHPIWSEHGDFPPLVKEIVAKKSAKQGFPRSRLPTFTDQERVYLKGSSDFLGINHYTTFLVKRSTTEWESPSFDDDVNVDLSYGEEWKHSKSAWLKSAPYGLYRLCLYLNKEYDYPLLFITEHGWSTGTGLGDKSRVDNLLHSMFALLLGIEDGAEVLGYTAWSLMDNVEWTAGTSERFGFYEVDFDSEAKTRTPRLSAHVYKNLIETRHIDHDWQPTSLKMDISNRRMPNEKTEL